MISYNNAVESRELANETICILTSIINITGLLNQAISQNDTDQIKDILVTRESMCMDAGKCFKSLNMVTKTVDSIYFESTFDQIRLLSDNILCVQKECEKLLEDKIGECRSELSAFHRKSELSQIYKPVNKNRPASFIDSAI